MAAIGERAPLGTLLKDWRRRRRMSQLDLALEAGVSARHLSFLETGRSKPSREMVLHLAEELDVPLRDRNQLLLAAGYAPHYAERTIDSPEMAPVREALELVLTGHEPFPALVVDRWWNLVAANRSVQTLLDGRLPRAARAAAQRAARVAAPGGARAADREPRRVAGAPARPPAPGGRADGGPRAGRAARRAVGLPGRRGRARRAARDRRAAAAPRRRRRAALLQHGGDVRHGDRRHARRAVDRGVLPGRRGDAPPRCARPYPRGNRHASLGVARSPSCTRREETG